MPIVTAAVQAATWAWGLPLRLKLAIVAVVLSTASSLIFLLDGSKVYGDDRVDALPWASAPAASTRPTLPALDGEEAKALAVQFQPSVHLDADDGFPPLPVDAPFLMTTSSGRRGVCLSRVGSGFEELGDKCPILNSVAELAEHEEVNDDTWAVDFAPGSLAELKEAIPGLTGLLQGGVRTEATLGKAPMYFHAVPGPHGTIGLQYWFFYPFNYQPLIASLWEGGSGLFQLPLEPPGQHEGDFESIAVLLSAKLHPVYVWMARHDEEGQRFTWEEGVLDRPALQDSHLDVYAARGTHATYEFCSRKAREEKYRTPDDICREHLKITPLKAGEAPLIDLARTSWACWRGHFGRSPGRSEMLKLIEDDGPRMPLWQQHKFGDGARPCEAVRPPAQRGRDAAEMPDGARARALRARSGHVNGVFARCADWNQSVRAGAYIVACSDRALTRFVRAGLWESKGPCVRFVVEGDPSCRTPRVVPAAYHASNPSQLDDLRLTADVATKVDVYAAQRGTGRKEQVAFFEDVPLEPGRLLRVERPDEGWRLLDGNRVVATPVEAQGFTAHRRPGKPTDVTAVRAGRSIDVRFTTDSDAQRVRYVVAAAWDDAGLSDDPLVVRTIRPGAGTRHTVSLPYVAATAVRVSAYRDGMRSWTDATIRGGGSSDRAGDL